VAHVQRRPICPMGHPKVDGVCRECGRSNERRYNAKLRKEVLEAYGGACACCGERTEAFLQIDHTDGGGNVHRRMVGKVYKWLRKNNYPAGFRVLCANCNSARGLYGRCPHEEDQ
jgi:hypothetical protein